MNTLSSPRSSPGSLCPQRKSIRCRAVNPFFNISIADIATSLTGDAAKLGSGAADAAVALNPSIDITSLPAEALVVGAVITLVVGAGIALSGGRDKQPAAAKSKTAARSFTKGLPRENCVLVLGASGRSGLSAVKALLNSGKSVVAACQKDSEIDLTPGKQENGTNLFIEKGVDITNAKTVSKKLFEGVTRVVIAAAANRDKSTPEKVEAEGVENVIKQAVQHLPASKVTGECLLDIKDLSIWEPRDDIIMGGSSSSAISVEEASSTAKWSGNIVLEDGGFCGVRSPECPMNLSAYDGVRLRVKGNGETFKFSIKTTNQGNEQAYQASFNTEPDTWLTVSLPWHEFVPVNKATYDPAAGALDPSSIDSYGIFYSRFAFNGLPNANFHPGAFSLELKGGVFAYAAPRPSVVLISSASTERNAIIGDDAAARQADIPIVQLNPMGTLNWKYKGEMALRKSGLPYVVLRPTGLIGDVDPDEGKPYALELSQGDTIAGRLSREDLSAVIVQSFNEPACLNSTVEIKRTDRWAVGGPVMFDGTVPKSEWLPLVADVDRPKRGLAPVPVFVPPPEAVSDERKQEILNDPRVKAVQARSNQVEEAPKEEAPAAEKVEKKESAAEVAAGGAVLALRKAAVKQWVTAYRERSAVVAAEPEPVEMSVVSEEEIAANKAEVKEWIAKWRLATVEASASAAVPPPVDSSQKEEVQQWIANWRATCSGGAKQEVQMWIANWRAGNGATNGAGKVAVAKEERVPVAAKAR